MLLCGSRCTGFGFETQPRRVTPSTVARLFLCLMYPRLEHIETDGFNYVYMQDRKNQTLTNDSAVYVLVEHHPRYYDQVKVIYVGMTTNMNSRLKYPHPAERQYGTYLNCFAMETDIPLELEKEFIKRYRPLLNIQHNG